MIGTVYSILWSDEYLPGSSYIGFVARCLGVVRLCDHCVLELMNADALVLMNLYIYIYILTSVVSRFEFPDPG